MPEPSENRPKPKKLFWLGLGLFGASMAFNAAADYYFTDAKSKNEISYDNFVAKVKDGEIKGNVSLQYTDIKSLRVSVPEQKEYFTTTHEGDAKTRPPIPYYTITSQSEEKVRSDLQGASREVTPVYIAPEQPSAFMSFLTNWGPTLLFIGFFGWMLTRASKSLGGGGASAFGKSKAKMLKEEDAKVKFADVAGADEAKEDMSDFVEFLKDPQTFQRLGGKMPKGALMVGPPGTGKTLLAKAVAGEAGVPFFSISGSNFVEMFVGVGAARVRDMFEEARKHAPCIIFIDEIDAMGRHRGAGIGGGNDEREQTLNQLLVEMDGFDTGAGIIILAATNRPDVLDPALLRPGRFDRQVVVNSPDAKGREQILKVHTGKLEKRAGHKDVLAEDVDLAVLARGTPGFSGADIENLVNEAALFATKRGAMRISMHDFEEAKDKVMMGPQRKSMVMRPEERRLTAYHEAGHALVGLKVPGNDALHKVTILPRGRALGVTMSLPEQDRVSITRAELMGRMAMMFGGRVAEEIINGGPDNVTTGAANDIKQATEMADRMVTEWGMSDKLGRVRYSGNQEDVFLGMSMAKQKNISEETARLIDSEIRSMTEAAEAKARDVLTACQADLDKIANALLQHETLSGKDIHDLLEGKQLEREQDIPSSSGGAAPGPDQPTPL